MVEPNSNRGYLMRRYAVSFLFFLGVENLLGGTVDGQETKPVEGPPATAAAGISVNYDFMKMHLRLGQ
jgi:hypothetical protein